MQDRTADQQHEQRQPVLNRLKTVNAFTSVIETFEVVGHEQLNPRVLDAIAAMRSAEEGEQSSNRLGWHSRRDFFKRQEPALKELAEKINFAVLAGITRYWPEFDPKLDKFGVEGWVNVNSFGAFNSPHAHGGSHLSGSYYVRVPERSEAWSGAIEFLTPLGGFAPQGDFGKKMCEVNLTLSPQAGQLVLFPSYLRHWVLPNREDEDRVSVAFNVLVPNRQNG